MKSEKNTKLARALRTDIDRLQELRDTFRGVEDGEEIVRLCGEMIKSDIEQLQAIGYAYDKETV